MAIKVKSRILGAWIFLAAFCSFGAVAQAIFPVLPGDGMWNVTITNSSTEGSGYIKFYDDPTYGKIVAGYLIIKAQPFIKPANAPAQFSLGFFLVEGFWNFIGDGSVTGFFSGGSEDIPFDVSFTATGVDIAKISIKGTSTNGALNLKGVPSTAPAVPTTDLTGLWSGEILKRGVEFIELFALSPHAPFCLRTIANPASPPPTLCDLELPSVNLYSLAGAGAGYEVSGAVLLSTKYQIGLVLEELAVNKDTGETAEEGVVRSVTGKLKAKILSLLKGTMKGTDDDSPSATIPDVHMTMTLIVSQNAPSITTALQKNSDTPALTLSINIGDSVHDTVTLTGATPTAGGTVAYTYYTDSSCSLNPVSAGTKTVTNGIAPNSDDKLFDSGGTFYWQAVYSGDANNQSATSPCNEVLLVPSITTALQKGTGTQSLTLTINTGEAVHDTATLIGVTADAGGTVDYTYYTDISCSLNAVSAGTKTVTNGVVPNSDDKLFGSAGTFFWQAVYSGDANNQGATSACNEVLTVN